MGKYLRRSKGKEVNTVSEPINERIPAYRRIKKNLNIPFVSDNSL
jgi:hypothetical protein